MNELDRLLEHFEFEIDSERNENDSQYWYLILRPKPEFQFEYILEEDVKSLIKQIQEKIEKAEKWDLFEREDPDATIPIVENIDLRQQNKALTEELEFNMAEVLSLTKKIEQLKVEKKSLQISYDTDLSFAISERDELKSKIEKITVEVNGLLEMNKRDKIWNPRVMKLKEILGENKVR